MKVCLPSSVGGHLTELRLLRGAYSQYEHFYVLNRRIELPDDMEGRTHFIQHAERNWRQIINLVEAWQIIRAEAPDVILSTGASPAVVFALIGKLFGCRVIFVETIARVNVPSLTGRIMYRLADRFYYQWQPLARFFPRGRCRGRLI